MYNQGTGGAFTMAGKPNNKYSYEFKKEAVEKYFTGQYGGYDILSARLGLRSSKQLRDWVKLYRQDPDLLKQDNRGKASKKRWCKKRQTQKGNS